jgi:hypothetical protein
MPKIPDYMLFYVGPAPRAGALLKIGYCHQAELFFFRNAPHAAPAAPDQCCNST